MAPANVKCVVSFSSQVSTALFMMGFSYSLFHQILGVNFFQFSRSLYKKFNKKFSRIIFSSSPNIPENLVDFFCVLAKLDHLACNKFSKLQLSNTITPHYYIRHYRETRILLHAKWSNFRNTQHNCTKFSGMLGGDKKNDPRKILLKKFEERPSKLVKLKLVKGYSQDLVKQTVVQAGPGDSCV